MQMTREETNRTHRVGRGALAIGLPALLCLLLLGCQGAGVFPFVGSGTSLTVGSLTAEIVSPANETTVIVNSPVVVQAAATSDAGVERIELWVGGRKMGELTGLEGRQRTVLASFQWVPAAPGWYTVEVRAYAGNGAIGSSAQITVDAVSSWMPATSTPVATATLTPMPVPTCVPAPNPILPPQPLPPPDPQERGPRQHQPEREMPPDFPDNGRDVDPHPPDSPGDPPPLTPQPPTMPRGGGAIPGDPGTGPAPDYR